MTEITLPIEGIAHQWAVIGPIIQTGATACALLFFICFLIVDKRRQNRKEEKLVEKLEGVLNQYVADNGALREVVALNTLAMDGFMKEGKSS